MPRSKSLKTIILELVMYIGMFAVVGHICENLFQRLMMQHELVHMKSDLNSLQLYINSIEMAYDNLREEFQDLTYPNKRASKPIIRELPIIKPSYEAYIMYKPSRDSNIHGLYKELVDVKSSFVQTTNDFMQNFQRSVKDFTHECKIPVKDSSLIERHIKCIFDDSIEGDMRDCKCVIKCSRDQSELKVEPENMENESILTEKSIEQRESTANATDEKASTASITV